MKLSTNTIIVILGILVFGMMAAISVTMVAAQVLNPQPEENVLATLQAMTTPTAVNMPTQTPLPATSTVVPVTSTSIPPVTAISYCDWVSFVKDVSIPDGTEVLPGETFTKIWRLKNRGTCTWSSQYILAFHSGAQMSGTYMAVPGTIAPGQTVDVAVTFTAPTTPGHYVGYWMLRNPSGVLFGTGDRADETFYVDVYVKDIPHGTVGGNLCYPSEFNPPLTLYFEKPGSAQPIQFSIPEAQNSYSVLLPTGTYYAYAWAPGYNLEGAYTGSDGLMKTFTVESGLTTPFINLCDWSPYPHARGQ